MWTSLFLTFALAAQPAVGSPAAAPPSTAPVANDAPEREHHLQRGDRVRITLERTDLDGKVALVGADGQLALGVYGDVLVEGMTLAQATLVLRRQLSTFVRSTAGLHLGLHQEGRLVDVTGMVKTPGPLVVNDQMSLWQVLLRSGGPLDGADLTRVEVRRNGQTSVIDVLAVLSREQNDPFPVLQAGDSVFVPAERGVVVGADQQRIAPTPAGLSRSIFVTGAVVAPGLYPLPQPLDVVVALNLAKGPRPDALLSKARLVVGSRSIPVDLEAALSGRALPVDVDARVPLSLFVPSAEAASLARQGRGGLVSTVDVVGGVLRPGAVALADRASLVDVITAAGGIDGNGDLTHVTVVRRQNGISVSTTYDVKQRMSAAMAPVWMQPGDIVLVRQRQDHPVEWLARGMSQVAVLTGLGTLLLSLVLP